MKKVKHHKQIHLIEIPLCLKSKFICPKYAVMHALRVLMTRTSVNERVSVPSRIVLCNEQQSYVHVMHLVHKATTLLVFLSY